MVEGILFLLLGLFGLLDTVRPQRVVQAKAYGDFIGTLLYVGFLSAGLLIGGVVLCIKNRSDLGKLRMLFGGNLPFRSARKTAASFFSSKVAIAFLTLAFYAGITPYLGYVLSTFLFFLGIFGWQGYKWSLRNLVLSLVTALAFAAFAHIAEIPLSMGPPLFD